MESNGETTLKTSESGCSAVSDPHGQRSSSLFNDGSCGEPLVSQHLVLDFTPDEELDNEIVQKKCCDFWELISKRPELQNLMVFPDPNIYRKNIETSAPSEAELEISEHEPERTAVSMLEIVEGKGLIDRIFETKLPQSQCSLGSREYRENKITLPRGRNKKKTVCRCAGSNCTICRRQEASETSPLQRTVDLCRTLQEWDAYHPKSMEPPGHPPALSHCVMQRNNIS